MRLKEIKEGMVIRCADKKERKLLWEELCRIGNMSNWNDSLENFVTATSNVKICDLKSHTWCFCGDEEYAINFSDLIIKDELTNEEVIELLAEILISINLSDYVFGDFMCTFSDLTQNYTPNDIIAHLVEYKKEKVIKIVSKSEYAKVASDKLDELYPKGWMMQE